jgi:hypothetical protein
LPELQRIPRGAASFTDENGAIGRLMQTTFVTAPPFWTARHAIDVMRDAREEDLPDNFFEIYRRSGAPATSKSLVLRDDRSGILLVHREGRFTPSSV